MSTATQRHTKTASEARNVVVSFKGKLDAGELLTGTPTVEEVTTTDLTLTNKAVNTAELTILGTAVAIGEAVQFKVAGGTAGTEYTIRITSVTNATAAQTLVENIKLRVISN